VWIPGQIAAASSTANGDPNQIQIKMKKKLSLDTICCGVVKIT
jgi:hypothetical protein